MNEITSIEYWYNENDMVKPKNQEQKTCPGATLSTIVCHKKCPGIILGPTMTGCKLTT